MENGCIETHLDVVDGVYVVHGVLDDAADLLQALIAAHSSDRIALNMDIAPRQNLKCLLRITIRAQYPLAAAIELFLIADHLPNLNNIASNAILEHLDSLGYGDRAGEQLDEVAGLKDGGGVVSLEGGGDDHAALDQVQLAVDVVLGK